MSDKIIKIKEEIARLEKLMERDHFGSVVDKNRGEYNYNRLKKLRKELKKLEENE